MKGRTQQHMAPTCNALEFVRLKHLWRGLTNKSDTIFLPKFERFQLALKYSQESKAFICIHWYFPSVDIGYTKTSGNLNPASHQCPLTTGSYVSYKDGGANHLYKRHDSNVVPNTDYSSRKSSLIASHQCILYSTWFHKCKKTKNIKFILEEILRSTWLHTQRHIHVWTYRVELQWFRG